MARPTIQQQKSNSICEKDLPLAAGREAERRKKQGLPPLPPTPGERWVARQRKARERTAAASERKRLAGYKQWTVWLTAAEREHLQTLLHQLRRPETAPDFELPPIEGE